MTITKVLSWISSMKREEGECELIMIVGCDYLNASGTLRTCSLRRSDIDLDRDVFIPLPS